LGVVRDGGNNSYPALGESFGAVPWFAQLRAVGWGWAGPISDWLIGGSKKGCKDSDFVYNAEFVDVVAGGLGR